MSTAPDFLICPVAPELPAPHPSPALASPRRSWKRGARWVGLVSTIIVFAPLVYGMAMIGYGGWTLQQTLRSAQARASQGEMAAAGEKISEARGMLRTVRHGARALGFWRLIPPFASQVKNMEMVLEAGETTLDGVERLIGVGVLAENALEEARAPEKSLSQLTPEEKRFLMARLHAALPALRVARDQLAIAMDALEHAPQERLWWPIQEKLRLQIEFIAQTKRLLDHALPLAEMLIPLAGYPQPKTYLVLLQNADELRPTGGFIGTVGILEVDAGEIKRFQFQDVYAIDGPVEKTWKDLPPEILRRELKVPAWFLRDSNWSPDFPQSAERVLDVYTRERILGIGSTSSQLTAHSSQSDGVIALQPGFFQRLLQLTGPVHVDGKTFDAENFFTQLQYDVEIGFREDAIPLAQRKEIVAKLGDALLETLLQQPSSRWSEFLDLVTDALEKKDLLIYTRDPGLLSLLDARGWTGRVRSTDGDYLWVVDANLAALKTDGVMEKKIHYTRDARNADRVEATVTLTYRNTNRRISWRHTRYRDYVRVYVPEGSELLATEGAIGAVDVMRDLGKTVFGAFWVIEPGETRTLIFRYRLPISVSDLARQGLYTLLVQKQPGAKTDLTIEASFGKKVIAADPPEAPKEFGDARYRVSLPLEKDQKFKVSF